jgi:hypothetical protein
MTGKQKKSASRKKKAEPKPPFWFRRLVFAAAVVLVFIVIGTAVFFVSFLRSGDNVVLELEGPGEVLRGVPFEVSVNVNNNTDSLVSGAELSVSPGKGVRDLGNLDGNGVFTDSIGDLGSGSLAKKTYRFIATAPEGEEEIVFSMSYFSSHQNSFETRAVSKVKIRGEAAKIEIEKPEQILPGSVFGLNIKYENLSGADLPEAVLKVEYPSAFRFVSASLEPDSLNNYWRLGELMKNSSGNLEIRGRLEGGGSGPFTLPVTLSSKILGEDFPVAEGMAELSVSPSPVGLSALINRRESYVARVGDRLTYIIRYENSSGIALTDVVLKAGLSGEMYDFSSISSNGQVNVAARTVTWDVSNVPALRLVGAGAAGEVSFEVKLKDQFPINRLNDKNFSLKLLAELTSPSVPYYLSASETRAEASVETKVAGLVGVDAQAFYRDPLSKIINIGPMPPKVGTPTAYTIHWILRNYGTDISNVSVKIYLPENVRWTGIVKSNTDTVPLYDEETREVAWNLEAIRATKGVLDEPLAAVFQIEATPVNSDLGNFQNLVSATILSAIDDFTGLELVASDIALTSFLPDDVTVGGNGGRVTP